MIFYLKDKSGEIIATAKLSDENSNKTRKGILILEGSKMSKAKKETKKWVDCPWIEESRQMIIDKELCNSLNSTHYALNKDVFFSSPNRAACALLGYITTAAWHEFVNEEGLSMHQIYREIK